MSMEFMPQNSEDNSVEDPRGGNFTSQVGVRV